MVDNKEIIKEQYTEKLRLSKDNNNSCCNQSIPRLSMKPFEDIPSFGCILNLPEKAGLTRGDIVVDFGSGPGYDLINAAKIVGSKGRVIGIDMTLAMIENAKEEIRKSNLENVEVKMGEIEKVPLDDCIADVVISNCVINLAANKSAVFKEAFRILKPGGKLVDADIIAGEDLPESLQNDNESWCNCIGGALTQEGYTKAIKDAGFIDIDIVIDHSIPFKWQGKEIQMYSGIITAKKPT